MSALPFPTEVQDYIKRGVYTGRMPTMGSRGAVVHLASAGRKLSPIAKERYDGAPGSRPVRPVPVRPYVVSTYVSIESTCPSSCTFRGDGCYVTSGFTARANRKLDASSQDMDGDDVIAEEVRLLDSAFAKVGGRVPQDGGRCGESGRDLRLHVGGDVSSAAGACALGAMAKRWRQRGGGDVWTYTHRWAEIPRYRWSRSISVLASIERPEHARHAMKLGYVPAVVVPEHVGRRAAPTPLLPEGWRLLPCPAETTPGRTCVTCRLCFDDSGLRQRKLAIGFSAHGTQADAVRRSLPIVTA